MFAWAIDTDKSVVEFSVRYLLFSTLRGRFHAVRGHVCLDEKNIAGSFVHVDIEIASIDTGDRTRDAVLLGPDFFNAATHPLITFTSSGVRSAGGNRLRITGDLTIRGVTRQAILEGEDDFSGKRPDMRFAAKTIISREDYGITLSNSLEPFSAVVSDEIQLRLDVKLVVRKSLLPMCLR